MEQVLVFNVKELKKLGISNRDELWLESDEVLIEIFENDILPNAFYMDRDKAEKDPSFKQVIPYCIVTKDDEVFAYKRSKKGGEKRLHEMWSIGVGGHINPCDGIDPHVAFGMAVQRELTEELSFSDPELMEKAEYEITGLIYDKSDSVGKVHFGVIVEVDVPKELKVWSNSKELDDYLWADIETLLATEEIEDAFTRQFQIVKNAPKIHLENWSEAIFQKFLEQAMKYMNEEG